MLNRRLPPHARIKHQPEGPVVRRMVTDFGQILRLPWARFVLLTVFLEGAFLYGPFAFIASHVHHVFGMSLTSAGALVMLFGAGGFLFAVSSGALGVLAVALRFRWKLKIKTQVASR